MYFSQWKEDLADAEWRAAVERRARDAEASSGPTHDFGETDADGRVQLLAEFRKSGPGYELPPINQLDIDKGQLLLVTPDGAHVELETRGTRMVADDAECSPSLELGTVLVP